MRLIIGGCLKVVIIYRKVRKVKTAKITKCYYIAIYPSVLC